MDRIKLLLPVALIILHSCSTTRNRIFWVSGVKTECSSGGGKMQCLNVHKGKHINDPNWETFYAPIRGFEFDEGYLQKIEVKESRLNKNNVPADGSTLQYELVKVLDKQKDIRATLHGRWTLVRLHDAPLNKMVTVPTMTIDLAKKRFSAYGGCNQFTAQIVSLTNAEINLGTIMGTKKACISKNIETEFQEAVNTIKTYEIKDKTVTFMDESGKKVLEFIKEKNDTPNQRLHDIWIATRINGNPINRMSPIPRLEVNLTEMSVMGNDGCNDYSGKIKEVSDTEIVLGPVASTNKMCRKMETSLRYNEALSNVKGYKLEQLTLILVNEKNEEVLSFVKGD